MCAIRVASAYSGCRNRRSIRGAFDGPNAIDLYCLCSGPMEDCVPGRLMFRDDSTGIWWPFSCRHSTRAECPSAGPMSCDVVAVSLVVSSAVTRRLSVPPNRVDRPNVVVSLTLQAAYQIDVWDGSNLSHNGYSCEVAEIGARVEKIIFHLDFRPRPTCSRIISSHPFPPCHTKPT